MQNIKKSAAIISLFIISGTGIYFSENESSANKLPDNEWSDNTFPSNKQVTEQSTANNHQLITDMEQQASFRSAIKLRKKIDSNIPTLDPLAHINMPKSLRDTDPSSLVHIDSDNQLMLNHDIKALFDYFFSSEGDLSPDELLASMQQYIKQAYPQPAAQQALTLLNKYVDYKQQMNDFYLQDIRLQDLPQLNTLNNDDSNVDKTDTLQTIEALMQDRQNMRENIFSTEEKEAMFGLEINYDHYMLTIAKLDADLSPTERQQQIAQTAERFLTETQQEARQQTFILQHSPPNFRIDDSGECQGNNQNFSTQQVTALCDLAHKRLARDESNS